MASNTKDEINDSGNNQDCISAYATAVTRSHTHFRRYLDLGSSANVQGKQHLPIPCERPAVLGHPVDRVCTVACGRPGKPCNGRQLDVRTSSRCSLDGPHSSLCAALRLQTCGKRTRSSCRSLILNSRIPSQTDLTSCTS